MTNEIRLCTGGSTSEITFRTMVYRCTEFHSTSSSSSFSFSSYSSATSDHTPQKPSVFQRPVPRYVEMRQHIINRIDHLKSLYVERFEYTRALRAKFPGVSRYKFPLEPLAFENVCSGRSASVDYCLLSRCTLTVVVSQVQSQQERGPKSLLGLPVGRGVPARDGRIPRKHIHRCAHLLSRECGVQAVRPILRVRRGGPGLKDWLQQPVRHQTRSQGGVCRK